jgi:hypothetical protein
MSRGGGRSGGAGVVTVPVAVGGLRHIGDAERCASDAGASGDASKRLGCGHLELSNTC